MTSVSVHISIAALTIALAAGSGAAAQGGDNASDGFSLDTIVVTARRVEEGLQQTPVSVTAFKGDELERRQIFNGEALNQVTPNFSFSSNPPLSGNNSASAIFIRGIGQRDPLAGADPGVGLYIDDVYVGQSVGGNFEFLDVQQVEILRGPQGTLFGRNAVGGAVQVRTVEPGDEIGGTTRFSAGNFNLRQAFGAIDLPLNDALRTRFSFGWKNQDGFVNRVSDGLDLGDEDTFTLRGKVNWQPAETLLIKVNAHFTRDDENGSPLVFAAYNESASFGRTVSAAAGCPGLPTFSALAEVPLIDDARCVNDFYDLGPYNAGGTLPLTSELDAWSLSATAIWNPTDWLTIKSITAHRDTDWHGVRDADNTPYVILHTDIISEGGQFTQEVQGVIDLDRMTGVVGFFYLNEEVADIFRVAGTPPPGEFLLSNDSVFTNNNWAVFAQFSYDLSEKLSITGGLRHTQETKGLTPDQYDFADPSDPFLTRQLFELEFDNLSFLANLSYQLTDQTLAYFTYSEGFKAGGLNSRTTTFQPVDAESGLREPIEFLPEDVSSYEIGIKSDLLDDRLRLNIAAFKADYQDLQFTFRRGVTPFITNAGAASIEGFEAEWTFVPVPAVQIIGGIGYTDALVDEVNEVTDATSGAAVGNRLAFAPEISFNTGISYQANFAQFVVIPRIDVSYRSRTFFDVANTPEIAQLSGYTVVNAGLNIENPGRDLRLTFGMNNATDTVYRTGGNSSLSTGSGYAEVGYARPRNWFIQIAKDF